MASRALSEPRNPHRPGPRGKQKTGPNRTLTLTDAGREAVRAYRAALAAESPGDWRVVHRMFGPPWCVRREHAIAGAERTPGMYYTPASVLDIIDPQAGSGAFLAELASNPPWGQS